MTPQRITKKRRRKRKRKKTLAKPYLFISYRRRVERGKGKEVYEKRGGERKKRERPEAH